MKAGLFLIWTSVNWLIRLKSDTTSTIHFKRHKSDKPNCFAVPNLANKELLVGKMEVSELLR